MIALLVAIGFLSRVTYWFFIIALEGKILLIEYNFFIVIIELSLALVSLVLLSIFAIQQIMEYAKKVAG